MAWSRKTWKFCDPFLRFFFGKTTPYGKLLKILFWKFTWWHKLMLLSSNVMKFVEQEIGEIVSYSHDKKNKQNFGFLSNCRYCALNLPGPAPNSWLTLFQISSKSIHFQWVIAKCVKAVLLDHRVFPWFASNTFEANNKTRCQLTDGQYLTREQGKTSTDRWSIFDTSRRQDINWPMVVSQ